MNKLVDSAILEREAERNYQARNARVLDDNYDRRVQALFEAIIAEGILERTSPDEVKSDSM